MGNPLAALLDTLNVATSTLVGGAAGAAVGTLILPGAGTAMGYILGVSSGLSFINKSKQRG